MKIYITFALYMISQLNPFTSGDFNAEDAANYTLLLSVGDETFTYAVVADGTMLAFGNQQIKEFGVPLALVGAEHLNYKQIIAGILPHNFAIVPNELFKEDSVADLATFLNAAEGDKILSQELDSANHIVFNCRGSLYEQLGASFPGAYINFLYKGWLTAIARKQPFNENIYLDIKSDCVHIANFKDHQLRFYNRFTIADENDLVYFTALVADELGIAKADILLSVSGNTEANDKNIAALKQFFRQVEINKTNPLEHLPDDAQPQQLLTLLALQLCV